MSRQWVFVLDFASTPEGLSANDRAHHMVKARSTALVRQLVTWKARDIPGLGRCRVDVEWVVNTRHRRDTDNLAPFLKAIYDGIGADKGVSAHLVADDDPVHMEKVGATIRYDKDATPHFEVTVTELLGGDTNA